MIHDPKIAILITCYNRRDKTLACLEALYKQGMSFNVYLTDDGSKDGTSEAVKSFFPKVKILEGDGSLFWGGGTRKAFAEALKFNYEYYLWLNDDTLLTTNALNKLLKTHYDLAVRGQPNSIVVGSIRDPITGKLTYGGRIRVSRWRPLKYKTIEPSDKPKECQTMNGNCVLIPRSVATRVGNIDNAFSHGKGDVDYGLRARQLNCSVWMAPGYSGICSRNPINNTWEDIKLPLYERLRQVNHPKGLPIKEIKVYAKRHGGLLWFLYWLSPYSKLIVTSIFKSLSIRKNRILLHENQNSNSKR